jgi:hypothetical protein
MKWPKEAFLQYAISWFLTGWLVQLMRSIKEQTTVGEHVGAFIVDIVAPMVFGAVCAEYAFISIPAALCGLIVIASLTIKAIRTPSYAQFALTAYFVLTMITIWIEPFFTGSGIVIKVAAILLKASTTIVDIGVTLLAFLMWDTAVSRVNTHFRNLQP